MPTNNKFTNIQKAATADTAVGAIRVVVSNSIGWIVNQANTSAGGDVVSISNSAGWIFAQSNTSPLVSIQNSSGWIFNQANTANQTVIIVGGSINVVNTAGIVVAISNTANNTVANAYDTNKIWDGTTELRMKYKAVAINGTSNTLIVNAVSDKRIRVMSLFVISNTINNLVWQSGSSAATDLTGVTFLASNVGYVLPFNPNGWFQTGTSTLLNALTTAQNSIGGCITYLETS